MTKLQDQIVEVDIDQWQIDAPKDDWIAAIEAGKVLYFPHLPFPLGADQANLFTPAVLDPGSRNISLGTDGKLKGAVGDAATLAALTAMVGGFREPAVALVAHDPQLTRGYWPLHGSEVFVLLLTSQRESDRDYLPLTLGLGHSSLARGA